MRKFLHLLSEYRQEQFKTQGVTDAKRLQEAVQLFEFMDSALSGLRVSGEQWEDPNTKLSEAMTSQDFSYALGEFVQRQMIPGYTAAQFAFEPLVKIETAPNYMDITRYQNRGALDDLEYVPEKGPVYAGSVDDAVKREMKVEVWQKQFDFSSRALINDDLGYFSSMAFDMGVAARRTLERFVSRMYNNATSIARLIGLGALYAQTGQLTTTRISEARMAFNQRTDADGNPIVASLRYLVVPRALEDNVATIQRSQQVPELATNAVNVVAGQFMPIVDPHIATNALPIAPWWAFADWRASNIVPLVLVRRQGMPAPQLFRKASDMQYFSSFASGGAAAPPILGDFETGNVVVKVYDEWGTYIDGTEGNLFDFRGAYYSSGVVA